MTAGRYAANTDVPADRSKAQIEQTLVNYGADQFLYGYSSGGGLERAVVQFRAHGRIIRFVMPMPRRDSSDFTLTPTGRDRSPAQAAQAWEQATRSRWRALLLAIKAKLEAVEVGLSSFESEFLPYTVLPNDQTVTDWLEPQLAEAYASGRMPETLDDVPALPAPRGALALEAPRHDRR